MTSQERAQYERAKIVVKALLHTYSHIIATHNTGVVCWTAVREQCLVAKQRGLI
jgi:hypothetical protein